MKTIKSIGGGGDGSHLDGAGDSGSCHFGGGADS